MKLRKLFPCVLALGLCFSIAACDGGDEGDSDTNAENNDSNNDSNNETEEGGMDVDCPTFCTSYVDICIQMNGSTEFETNDLCLEACGAWDQAGINCRHMQIVDGACDQAGNMGSACQ